MIGVNPYIKLYTEIFGKSRDAANLLGGRNSNAAMGSSGTVTSLECRPVADDVIFFTVPDSARRAAAAPARSPAPRAPPPPPRACGAA